MDDGEGSEGPVNNEGLDVDPFLFEAPLTASGCDPRGRGSRSWDREEERLRADADRKSAEDLGQNTNPAMIA